MSLVCSISGAAPEEPVVSKTGYIFEKRHIEKHLAANQACPITGEPLTVEELLPVKVSKIVKPRAATASSIPGLLTLMQNEWDSVMAETFTLRSHLETVRSQLSHTLYQHDAACRCIARLIRERDAARAQTTELQALVATHGSQRAAGVGGGAVELGITQELTDRMTDLEGKLRSGRRKRVAASIMASVEDVKTFSEAGSFPLHQSTSPGVLALGIDQESGSNIIASGGVDGDVVVFDVDQRKTVAKLTGHMKRVNCVLMHDAMRCVVSGSDDKTIRIWRGGDEDRNGSLAYNCAHTIRTLTGAVTGLSLHPLGDYFVSVANKNSWALHDIGAGRTVHTTRDISCEYRCIQLHPDGLLLGGGGADNSVHMWDLREPRESNIKGKLDGHTGPINALSFSQNGYYLATASDDGTVRLWDLRKKEEDAMSFQKIRPFTESRSHKDVPVKAVTFDHSGNYVAFGAGKIAEIYNFETKNNATQVATLQGHEDIVTDLKFGSHAKFLITSSMDRTVKLWESKDKSHSSGEKKHRSDKERSDE